MGVSEYLAFGFGIFIAVLISSLLSRSEWGEGVATSATELAKLTPSYWRRLAEGNGAVGVRQPSLIGRSQPVWTPDFLPSNARPRSRRELRTSAPRPMLQAPTAVASRPAQTDAWLGADLAQIPDWLKAEQPAATTASPGFWDGSPSPLGRTG